MPASLAYLRSIGENPSDAIRLVVASHWHDDHVKGLSRVVEEANSAKFVCSEAARSDEFLTLVELYEERPIQPVSSGVREMELVLRALENSRRKPIFAVANRKVFHDSFTIDGTVHTIDIHSLTPSDSAIQRGLLQVKALLCRQSGPRTRIPDAQPNDFAVVLWVEIDGAPALLLGSDLENTGQPTSWEELVTSAERPVGRACVFKVSHHGACSGHHDSVWTELLVAGPFAVLTPQNKLPLPLPRESDVERICSGRTWPTPQQGW